MKYVRFMISEDVKLVTIKEIGFTVVQSILNPTPWFLDTYALLHYYNNKNHNEEENPYKQFKNN
jgi:hypothetical protein